MNTLTEAQRYEQITRLVEACHTHEPPPADNDVALAEMLESVDDIGSESRDADIALLTDPDNKAEIFRVLEQERAFYADGDV